MTTRYSSHCFWNCATLVLASSSSTDIASTFARVSSILNRPFFSLSAASPSSLRFSYSSLRGCAMHVLGQGIALMRLYWTQITMMPNKPDLVFIKWTKSINLVVEHWTTMQMYAGSYPVDITHQKVGRRICAQLT